MIHCWLSIPIWVSWFSIWSNLDELSLTWFLLLLPVLHSFLLVTPLSDEHVAWLNLNSKANLSLLSNDLLFSVQIQMSSKCIHSDWNPSTQSVYLLARQEYDWRGRLKGPASGRVKWLKIPVESSMGHWDRESGSSFALRLKEPVQKSCSSEVMLACFMVEDSECYSNIWMSCGC